MAAGGDVAYLEAAAIYLGAAVVAVPLFKRLKLGSVLGYLAAGVAMGPYALGLIDEPEIVLRVAEFGVVLLLFVIGLELKPARLWRLRYEVFGLGFAQVAVTMLIAGVLAAQFTAAGFSLDWRAAVVAGAGLALSSTAFAIQILRERGDLSKPYGNRSFAILLFQDLAIVPLIAMVGFLAPRAGDGGGESVWWSALVAVSAVALVYFAGRYALKPLFRAIADAKAEEVFTAAALLVVVASALLMEAVGLSMAMGAFLAGVLLAESEFRHQLETDIEPFRGLLMGLFFIAVGMSVNLDLVATYWVSILLGVLGLVALKIVILYGLARAAGSSAAEAVMIAAVLSQGGEFGFVLFAEALAQGVMGVAAASILTAIVTLSMASTPLVVLIAERLSRRWATSPEDGEEGLQKVEDADQANRSQHMIIAGFGRSGQVVARLLRMKGYEVTLIDNNPRRIRFAETFGNLVFFGDARRLDTLASAGADQARAIFLCTDDRDGARGTVERIRARFPNLVVYAMTYDRFSLLEMEKAGAHGVERETFESAIALTRRALEEMQDVQDWDDLLEEFRRRDQQLLKLQAKYGAYEGLKKLREEFSLEEKET